MLHKEKPLQWEACTPQLESNTSSPQLEKSPCSNRDPTRPKINEKKKKIPGRKWVSHSLQASPTPYICTKARSLHPNHLSPLFMDHLRVSALRHHLNLNPTHFPIIPKVPLRGTLLFMWLLPSSAENLQVISDSSQIQPAPGRCILPGSSLVPGVWFLGATSSCWASVSPA